MGTESNQLSLLQYEHEFESIIFNEQLPGFSTLKLNLFFTSPATLYWHVVLGATRGYKIQFLYLARGIHFTSLAEMRDRRKCKQKLGFPPHS